MLIYSEYGTIPSQINRGEIPMYCKNCNINYKKDRKVCAKCGAALLSGSAGVAQEAKFKQKRMRNIIILSSASALLVVAAFLIIFLIGRVPSELHGTWYESEGYGIVNFYPNGEMAITIMGNPYEGTYTFNSSTDSGTITYEGETDEFTYDGASVNWGGSIWTLNYVEQIEYDWDSMFGGLMG